MLGVAVVYVSFRARARNLSAAFWESVKTSGNRSVSHEGRSRTNSYDFIWFFMNLYDVKRCLRISSDVTWCYWILKILKDFIWLYSILYNVIHFLKIFYDCIGFYRIWQYFIGVYKILKVLGFLLPAPASKLAGLVDLSSNLLAGEGRGWEEGETFRTE